jgi:hypothetical protein
VTEEYEPCLVAYVNDEGALTRVDCLDCGETVDRVEGCGWFTAANEHLVTLHADLMNNILSDSRLMMFRSDSVEPLTRAALLEQRIRDGRSLF